jgi:hypothetical protein
MAAAEISLQKHTARFCCHKPHVTADVIIQDKKLFQRVKRQFRLAQNLTQNTLIYMKSISKLNEKQNSINSLQGCKVLSHCDGGYPRDYKPFHNAYTQIFNDAQR